MDTVVDSVEGAEKVESLAIRNTKTGAAASLDVAGLFVSIGTEPQTAFVRGFLELNEWEQVKVDLNMASSVPGVSDACPKQIATAVGTGVHAALSVQEYLSRLT